MLVYLHHKNDVNKNIFQMLTKKIGKDQTPKTLKIKVLQH